MVTEGAGDRARLGGGGGVKWGGFGDFFAQNHFFLGQLNPATLEKRKNFLKLFPQKMADFHGPFCLWRPNRKKKSPRKNYFFRGKKGQDGVNFIGKKEKFLDIMFMTNTTSS